MQYVLQNSHEQFQYLVEMAAVANACDLRPPDDGLGFPACGVDDLPHILRPKSAGGILEHEMVQEAPKMGPQSPRSGPRPPNTDSQEAQARKNGICENTSNLFDFDIVGASQLPAALE